jgi:hypothetical protein
VALAEKRHQHHLDSLSLADDHLFHIGSYLLGEGLKRIQGRLRLGILDF